MNDDKPSMGGFTIIETLIVLAITGFLLLIALLAFQGQQAKVEFGQSVRDMQSIIQQTINEVAAGYFPDSNNIKCQAAGNSLSISQGSVTQGSNTDCIFLGKAMQFGVGGTDPQQYNVLTLAGLKDNNGDLAQARPTVVDLPGVTTNNIVRNGVKVVSMKYVVDNAATDIGAVAFISGLGSFNDGQLLSGSQQISLVPVTNSGKVPNTIDQAVVDAVKDHLATSPINPNGGVQICFQSGGTKQSGLITIGGGGRNLSVDLAIKSTTDCT